MTKRRRQCITSGSESQRRVIHLAEHIFFNGVKYFKTAKGYWMSTTNPAKQLHVEIWKSAHGEVPAGCHIHHIDLDPTNNALENLQCLTVSEHRSLHCRLRNQRPKNYNKPTVCVQCGKVFMASRRDAKYCSAVCHTRWRVEHGLCHTNRICEWCGKEFLAINPNTRHCSAECTRLSLKNERLPLEIRAEIRRVYRKGDKEFGARPLARKYGVDKKTITNIVNE